MKQLLLAICVSAISIMNVQAQENKSAPKFEFKDISHDFGTVPEGPEVTHYFDFKNSGKEPLIIQSVTASCGCTSPDWPKQPILPGKSSQIKVVYSTDHRVGPFSKDIFIKSNAANPDDKEVFELHIKGTVTAKPTDTEKG